MTFFPRGKALFGQDVIFLFFRVIGLALKCLKKERGRGWVSKLLELTNMEGMN